MATILGIMDSAVNTGATLVQDGEVTAAVQEERTNRVKHSGGFPFTSIKEVLRMTNTKPDEVDGAVIGRNYTVWPVLVMQARSRKLLKNTTKMNPLKNRKDRYRIKLFELYPKLCFKSKFVYSINNYLSDKALKKYLSKLGINAPLHHVEHHLAHAASAYYTSGFKEAVVVTADARGDKVSMTVNITDDNGIKRIAESPWSSSMGNFYGGITEALDFGYGSGEGKTEALAAYGEKTEAYDKLKQFISVDGMQIKGKMHDQRLMSIKFAKLLGKFRKQDIAWAGQTLLEETFEKVVESAVKETGIKNIAVAGGLFLNVKLNQRIYEIPDIKDIYIHPSASDAGLPTGAALYLYQQEHGLKNRRWKHALLGPEYTDSEIKEALKKSGHKFEQIKEIERYVAEELLPKDYIVGWFDGRMEYGPRALGSRSVLITPKNPKSPDKIRSTIKNRPPFQPFCPSMTIEASKAYLQNPKNVEAPFMILTLNATDKMAEEAPAVVFIDRSVRTQNVERKFNPRYYDLIKAFGKETGTPIVLNTSFNKSGESIVCTPTEAIHDLTDGKLDYLAIGNYLVKNPVL